MTSIRSIVAAGFFVFVPAIGFAQTATPPEPPNPVEILESLKLQSGTIALGTDLATARLDDKFRFLNNADTQTFLTKIWGNPPGAGRDALGLILPTDVNPLTGEGWAVIVRYEASGHVSDEEAGKIDYAALMKDMQASVAEDSKTRVSQGHEPLELLGWAREPFYDPAQKKLFWAKRLRFGTTAEETLNYDIRALGRKGVLSMNVVASMGALPAIDERVKTILSMVDFKSGQTYADFQEGVDPVAAYGIAGLIAGGVLAKAGFFKGIFIALLAAKKFLLIGAFAAFAGLWSLFRRRSA